MCIICGKPNGERREAGVGFAIKNDIVTKLTETPRPLIELNFTSVTTTTTYKHNHKYDY